MYLELVLIFQKDNDEIQSYLNLGYNTAKKHKF